MVWILPVARNLARHLWYALWYHQIIAFQRMPPQSCTRQSTRQAKLNSLYFTHFDCFAFYISAFWRFPWKRKLKIFRHAAVSRMITINFARILNKRYAENALVTKSLNVVMSKAEAANLWPATSLQFCKKLKQRCQATNEKFMWQTKDGHIFRLLYETKFVPTAAKLNNALVQVSANVSPTIRG